MTDIQFYCPQCGGRHFGSTTEQRPDGSIWKISEQCHDEFKKGCKFTRPKIVCVAKGEKIMRDSLKARWLQLTGEEMPDDIAGLPVPQMKRAVELTEAGMVVCIPKTPVVIPVSENDSMLEWDSSDEGRLNAYGS